MRTVTESDAVQIPSLTTTTNVVVEFTTAVGAAMALLLTSPLGDHEYVTPVAGVA